MKTAVPDQLYAAFQQEIPNGINVTKYVSGWITQPGYPVLTVKVSSNRKSAVISQRRFLPHNPKHTDDTVWSIPITYASNVENDFNRTVTNQFLFNESMRINFDGAVDWIVFNLQQTGKGQLE